MKKTAIICEINPYHNGHQTIFDRAGDAFGGIVIAVMSGNFTQRGIPAVFDKYTRAALLVEKGSDGRESAADIVVELPFPWCCGGTEAFAMGGAAVALGMGADSLVCGSENGDTDFIKRAAGARDSAAYLERLCELEKSTSARGLGSAVLNDRVMGELGFSLGANDKLAAEYFRNLSGHDVEFRVFPRISDGGDLPYKSATELRELMAGGRFAELEPYVPKDAFQKYAENQNSAIMPHRYADLSYTFCRLFYRGEEYAESKGGLAEHLRSAALQSSSAAEFFDRARTKKYTDARIRRAVLFAMLRVNGEILKTPPAYTVLLAANGRGREYLAELRKSGTFPIITKPSDVPLEVTEQYRFLGDADSLYTMCSDVPREHDRYIKKHPVITL